MNILLIGFMGTGKSTLGKRVAEILNFELIDTDQLIEKREGRSIPQIFAEDGESYFRQLEFQLAGELAQVDQKVIATGGGFPLNPCNIEAVRHNCLIVLLTATPEVIYGRVKDDTGRPLLKDPEPLNKINRLLRERAQFYENADFTLDTGNWDLNRLSDNLIAEWRRRGESHGESESELS